MSANLDWDLLRSFRAVMLSGNLSAAARALKLTQPSIGRHIETLEAQLGLPLFTRSPQGLTPTQAARELLPFAETMAAAAEALARHASGEAQEAQGSVRLAASEVIGVEVLPPILTRFSRQWPKIDIELVLSNQIEDLLRRDVDIAVRMVRPTQAALIARKVGLVEIGLWARRDYLESAGIPRTLGDLAGHTMIGFDRNPMVTQWLQEAGLTASPAIFRCRTDADNAAMALVRQGYGIGGMPGYIAAREQGLVRVLPEVTIVRFETYIAMHEDLATSRRMRLMFDHLVEEIALAIRMPRS